jgi:hypothetical protein
LYTEFDQSKEAQALIRRLSFFFSILVEFIV